MNVQLKIKPKEEKKLTLANIPAGGETVLFQTLTNEERIEEVWVRGDSGALRILFGGQQCACWLREGHEGWQHRTITKILGTLSVTFDADARTDAPTLSTPTGPTVEQYRQLRAAAMWLAEKQSGTPVPTWVDNAINRMPIPWAAASTDAPKPAEIVTDEMVNRFLNWILPPSVCTDLCTTRNGETGRLGTSLLTATEARQMLEHVLNVNQLDEPKPAENAGAGEGEPEDTDIRWCIRCAENNGLVETVRDARSQLAALLAALKEKDSLASQVQGLKKAILEVDAAHGALRNTLTDKLKEQAETIDSMASAIRLMLEMYDKHERWCGNRDDAPGDSIHWIASNRAKEVLGQYDRRQAKKVGG